MQYKVRKEAVEILNNLDKNKHNCYFIHYSCEHFTESESGYSPRIASIAVYNLGSGQTISFSIHQVAEINHISFQDIDACYADLEKKMLDDFFSFVNSHQICNWIHWNMRSSNYGFQALEHRYKVLGGTPIVISDSNKYDLSKLFKEKYGLNYIESPKMENIFKKNEITLKDFLTGTQEVEAFRNNEFAKLYLSTLRKVYAFSVIFKLAIDNELKVNTTVFEQYGLSFPGVVEYCKNNVLIMLIWQILLLILGGYIGSLF